MPSTQTSAVRSTGKFKKIVGRRLLPIFGALLLTCITCNFTEPLIAKFTVPFLNLMNFGVFKYHYIDAKGLPQVYYANMKQKHYNAVYMSLYGLKYHDKMIGKEENEYFLQSYAFEPVVLNRTKEEYKQNFLNTADWLKDNLEVRQADGKPFGVWEYKFDWKEYNCKAPWVSGMAQGVGIQVLIRAYQLTKDKAYLDAAKSALQAFTVEVKKGGVTYKDSPTEWWYEEYAGETAKDGRVLNGMEHALIGIQEYGDATRDPLAAELLQKGLASLKASLKKYDAGWWTYYDALGYMANIKYHNVNINLTDHLFKTTGIQEFGAEAEHWRQYRSPFIVREVLKQRPNYSDLVLLFFNFTVLWVLLEVVQAVRGRAKRRAAA